MTTTSCTGRKKHMYSSRALAVIFLIILAFLTLASSGIVNLPASEEQSVVVTANADSGKGSLRQALSEATPGTVIRFSGDVFPLANPATISVLSPLPVLDVGYVSIDASDTGVILDGSHLPRDSEISGLDIKSSGNTIKGLEIVYFTASAIFISGGVQDNVIGGRGKGEGNILGGNLDGINIIGEGTSSNHVIGNLIGTDRSGLSANGNRAAGVWIGFGASGNIIGGVFGKEGNLISGNDCSIIIQGSNANTIAGNLIGPDITGKNILDPDDKRTGIGLNFTAVDNVIGGEEIELRNVISGNGDGINLSGQGVRRNQIIGNYIGTDPTGRHPLGNFQAGIHIMQGASENQIGPNNWIANNRKVGVAIEGADSIRNFITQNSIFSNEKTAIMNIDGGNLEIPIPNITSAGTRYIRGMVGPGQTIEIFSDEEEECRFYEASTVAEPSGAFEFTLPAGNFKGRFITALAIDEDGNTSELSESWENPGFGPMKELPGIIAPSQVSTEPAVLGTNVSLAIVSAFFFGFTSSVFNDIMKNYHHEITHTFKKVFPASLRNLFRKTDGETGVGKESKWTLAGSWLVVLSLTAIIESFLDANIGLISSDRMRTVLTLFTAGLAVSGLEWLSDRFAHRSMFGSIQIASKIHVWGMIFALCSVIISRVLNFQPGYLYGIMGAIYVLPKISGRKSSGERALIIQSTIFLAGLLLWGLSALLGKILSPLEPVLLTIFLITLQGVFFELLPLGGFDGSDLWKWKKGVWFIFFTAVFFCFYHLLLNPQGTDIQALKQSGTRILLTAMLIFGSFTALLWFLFPFRLRGR